MISDPFTQSVFRLTEMDREIKGGQLSRGRESSAAPV